jgi:hypothetical protein
VPCSARRGHARPTRSPLVIPTSLLLGEPEKFFTTPGYDGLPLVMLRLNKIGVRRLQELIAYAWRMRAEHLGA